MKLFNHIKSVLEQNENFCIDGKIFKNKVVEAALKLDPALLSILLKDEIAKKTFFQEVEGLMIFDKVKFQKFVSNKEFLPDSFTAFKNKIGLTANGEYLTEAKEVVLDFPFKDCVLEGGQTKEDQKRQEIFWNETLAPDEIDRLFEKKLFTSWQLNDELGTSSPTKISIDDNYIIKGNNLIVLHSLKEKYKKKIKLIYIDPPYNTGNDGFSYNDSFNHSSWLTFMKNRLEVSKELLCEEGVIFVQIDDREEAYLKILMDEIFGEENFLGTITVRAKSSAGASGGGEDRKLKKNYESIHVYCRPLFQKFNKIYSSEYLEDLLTAKEREKSSFAYNKVFFDYGTKEKFTTIQSGSGEEITVYKHNNYNIETVKSVAKKENLSLYETYVKYFENIFRTQDAQSSIRHKVVAATKKEGGLYSLIYIPKSGKNKGKQTELFYYKNEMVNFLTNVADMEDNRIIKHSLLGTLWDDIGWDGIANEGGVKLKFGKKPERLLKRIIEMSTDEGDLILDYHLGSGTTCAVAHKMKRRYIGIEQMDYENNDAIIRLQNVIKGEQSGISSEIKWKGGGNFISMKLAISNNLLKNIIESKEMDISMTEISKKILELPQLSYYLSSNNNNVFLNNIVQYNSVDQLKFLLSFIDKNQIYIPFSETFNNDFDSVISSEDYSLTNQFYI